VLASLNIRMTAKLCIYCFINVCLARFEVFIAVKIQVVVFWVMMPCSDVLGYHCFMGPCASIFRVKLEAAIQKTMI